MPFQYAPLPKALLIKAQPSEGATLQIGTRVTAAHTQAFSVVAPIC